MPRQRSKKLSSGRQADSQPASQVQQHEDEEESENESLGMLEKDSDEEELDRLVLGDDAGFMAQLGGDMELNGNECEEGGAAEESDEEDGGLEGVDDADLFFLDSGPSAIPESSLIRRQSAQNGESGHAPAWEDSDDDRLAISLAGNSRLRKLRTNETEDVVSGREYTRRLRRQFEVLNPLPEWAQSSRPAKRRRRSSAGSDLSRSSDDVDFDDEDLSTLPLARIMQDAGSLVRTAPTNSKRPKLRPGKLNIQRSPDIPLTQPSAVTSLSFHPEYPVLLSSGPASTLYLHRLQPTAHPTPNPLLISVHIKRTPITKSAFSQPLGDKIFFSGRRRYFHIWDLPSGNIQKVTRVYGQKDEQRSMERFKLSPCGRYMGLVGSSKKGGGIINVLDAKTTQWVASARIEGRNGVADFAWWSDGEGFTVVGKGGEVGEWSVNSRSFVARWIDDGYEPTVLTLGGPNGPQPLGGDRWVVIGSQSGIVNIYDRRAFVSDNQIKIKERPEPTKRFEQLTKATSYLQISPDGQLLCFSSHWKRDALRMVHLPSCTLYDWPKATTPLGRITAVAFGNESDILAVGNEAGKITMWDIRS